LYFGACTDWWIARTVATGGAAVTYSIVARDHATGQLGVAVQSCMFGVGAVVPWAEPGVGAVATQAIAEPAYGPRALAYLAAGATAPGALQQAQADDALVPLRQVGVVGADGSVAVATGDLCVDYAGHIVGDGFAVQANMMRSASVWPAMADAFVAARGSLARRLLAALVAAEDAGGDARGRMSCAIRVVDGSPAATPAAGFVTDLRVDRSRDPLGDLAVLLDAAEAFAGFHHAVAQLTSGDPDGALATIDDALRVLPEEGNLRFLRAGALVGIGRVDAGADELRALVAQHPPWEVIVRSFAAKGLIASPDGFSIDDVLG
jgi:uncharacterized Ntn-hydrolase superfamily protein